MVGQMRWLFWPSTIRAAYFAGGSDTSGAEQLQVQAARSPVASGLNLMVAVQSYHGSRNQATGTPSNDPIPSNRGVTGYPMTDTVAAKSLCFLGRELPLSPRQDAVPSTGNSCVNWTAITDD